MITSILSSSPPGNGAGIGDFGWVPQMVAAPPLRMKNSPSVRITGASTLRLSSGWIRKRSNAAPTIIAASTTIPMATQTLSPCSTASTKTTNVVNIAISPWAKLRWPVVL